MWFISWNAGKYYLQEDFSLARKAKQRCYFVCFCRSLPRHTKQGAGHEKTKTFTGAHLIRFGCPFTCTMNRNEISGSIGVWRMASVCKSSFFDGASNCIHYNNRPWLGFALSLRTEYHGNEKHLLQTKLWPCKKQTRGRVKTAKRCKEKYVFVSCTHCLQHFMAAFLPSCNSASCADWLAAGMFECGGLFCELHF